MISIQDFDNYSIQDFDNYSIERGSMPTLLESRQACNSLITNSM